MDLSFPGFDKHREVTRLSGDLAVLMTGVATRQGVGRTAPVGRASADDAAPGARLLAPLDGAFNGPMASALMVWKDE